jgi:hypothetical protein
MNLISYKIEELKRFPFAVLLRYGVLYINIRLYPEKMKAHDIYQHLLKTLASTRQE